MDSLKLTSNVYENITKPTRPINLCYNKYSIQFFQCQKIIQHATKKKKITYQNMV